MARPLRIDIENGWYHITARGIERKPIFLGDRYCEHFLELLEEMTERHAVGVHAYVLIGNHYHLILQTPYANASQAIQWLNVSYSAWFNAKRGRCGHVFQGRFGSKLIDGEGSWLLAVSTYLHLNPVRTASMGLSKGQNSAEARGLLKASKEDVQKRLAVLREHRWSSCNAYCGYSGKPKWLSTQSILARAGGKAAYRKYLHMHVTRGDDPEEYETLRGRVAIGGVAFLEKAKKMVLSVSDEQPDRVFLKKRIPIENVVAVVEDLKGEKWEDFKGRHGDTGKPLVLYLARKRSGSTLKEIGDWVGGMSYKAVSRAIYRFEEKLDKDKALSNLAKKALARL